MGNNLCTAQPVTTENRCLKLSYVSEGYKRKLLNELGNCSDGIVDLSNISLKSNVNVNKPTPFVIFNINTKGNKDQMNYIYHFGRGVHKFDDTLFVLSKDQQESNIIIGTKSIVTIIFEDDEKIYYKNKSDNDKNLDIKDDMKIKNIIIHDISEDDTQLPSYTYNTSQTINGYIQLTQSSIEYLNEYIKYMKYLHYRLMGGTYNLINYIDDIHSLKMMFNIGNNYMFNVYVLENDRISNNLIKIESNNTNKIYDKSNLNDQDKTTQNVKKFFNTLSSDDKILVELIDKNIEGFNDDISIIDIIIFGVIVYIMLRLIRQIN